ncbi:LacI family transcriptional regulator [Anaerosolibacter carboniphilus]|uniref:LacI family transcriptional regulator n=1 Tax=Anaerosolibacter carboniphilus TaxID=1417629 RepID=A0A841KTG1_9FIRM|nr:LacI family DNA-binding transcriptional regulator [Anaerosolibacter carboniphilus]MBB6215320.1 LacI family transcriptional regulator [Anaerosolibacter carboniphilus]
MKKRITIKDIAEKSGVSIGTVHCALSGKPGVSEETRLRIQKVAKDCGYRPNAVAASLKRKTIRIAAAFPGPTEDNRFFFTYVWEGVRDYMRTMSDFNVELLEVQYYDGLNNQADELTDLLKHTEVDGLLTMGYTDIREKVAIQRFIEKEIPVVHVGMDSPQSGRLCCVQPNYQIIGRTLAELIIRQTPKDGGILLCAGDAAVPAHYLIAQGFDAYLEEKGLKNPIYKIHTNKIQQEDYNRILRGLQREEVTACCSVNARGSVMLGKALIESGKAGQMTAVGSDLFEENFDYLRTGVFTNLLHKNPYKQAYLAGKYLVEYVLRGIRPPMDTVYVGSEIVFQSSMSMYEHGEYKLLF